MLGKFEHEVMALSLDELARWIAYFRIKTKEAKLASKKRR